MRSWTNYHGHSDYCDGQGKVEDYIFKAISLNMKAIGISSHAPVPFMSDWNMPIEKLPAYLKEVNDMKAKYSSQIRVFKSLEIDYVPGQISINSEIVKQAQLDYTVGSIHFVDAFPNGKPWAIDGDTDEFKEGLEAIFNNDIKAAILRFYELTREMLKVASPDIIGHFDKIKMHNEAFDLFDENDDWYLSEVRNTLALVAEKGVVVEINTKAIDSLGLLYPGPELFPMMNEMGIRVTINSDAHHPNKLILGFEKVAELLLQAGYTRLHEFIDGQWIPLPFNKDGVLFD